MTASKPTNANCSTGSSGQKSAATACKNDPSKSCSASGNCAKPAEAPKAAAAAAAPKSVETKSAETKTTVTPAPTKAAAPANNNKAK